MEWKLEFEKNKTGMCCRQEKEARASLWFTHRSNWTAFAFYTVSCLRSCADWQVAEMGDLKRKEVEWYDWLLAPTTGINSRMEARAAMTPAQQGIHFSPRVMSASEKSIPGFRCPPICYHSGHYWASLQFPVNMLHQTRKMKNIML